METLITVVILGILAAITVTSLVKSYQKTQTITKLKKTYADINQAIDVSVIENGPADTWQGSNQEKIRDYIIPYFRVDKVLTMTEMKRAMGNIFYEISGKQEASFGICRSSYNNSALAFSLRNNIRISVWITSSGILFLVDLNGPKKPNTFGKDIFVFKYFPEDNYFDFYSSCDTDKKYVKRSAEELKTSSPCASYKYGCNKNSRGMWCGALIEASGWQFPKDYPW